MRRSASSATTSLSVFGIMDAEELALVKPVARSLLARDALRADDYGGLSFGPGAKPILKGEEQLVIAVPPKRTRRTRGRGADLPHDPLFEALRGWRRERAKEQGVPPYVIFHDSTLREVAARKPARSRSFPRSKGSAIQSWNATASRCSPRWPGRWRWTMHRQLDEKTLVGGQIAPGRRRRR